MSADECRGFVILICPWNQVWFFVRLKYTSGRIRWGQQRLSSFWQRVDNSLILTSYVALIAYIEWERRPYMQNVAGRSWASWWEGRIVVFIYNFYIYLINLESRAAIINYFSNRLIWYKMAHFAVFYFTTWALKDANKQIKIFLELIYFNIVKQI